MISHLLKAFAVLLIGVTLSSCASISVKPGSEVVTQTKPDKVYFTAFDTSKGDFKVDREGQELTEFKRDLQVMMTTANVTDSTHRLIAADAYGKKKWPALQKAWLVKGSFTKVYQGSRLLRGTIGLGAGGTKLETTVYVYDLSTPNAQPFLTFSTTGGSNAEPGAISGIATDPITLLVGGALSGVSGVAHGLTEDTERTAREITAELSDYMYRQGWISKDQWIEPKAYEP